MEVYFTVFILIVFTLIGSLQVPTFVLFAWIFNTKFLLLPAYILGLLFDHEKSRKYVPPKRR
jgi:hypothetical protein